MVPNPHDTTITISPRTYDTPGATARLTQLPAPLGKPRFRSHRSQNHSPVVS